mmetsp:Transcript_15080/g.31533  ORF Transcript_15080/g.31533 Transcript_15080/m.31533 type:complete len:241 (+) Transcript_15080:1165-1887(+)
MDLDLVKYGDHKILRQFQHVRHDGLELLVGLDTLAELLAHIASVDLLLQIRRQLPLRLRPLWPPKARDNLRPLGQHRLTHLAHAPISLRLGLRWLLLIHLGRCHEALSRSQAFGDNGLRNSIRPRRALRPRAHTCSGAGIAAHRQLAICRCGQAVADDAPCVWAPGWRGGAPPRWRSTVPMEAGARRWHSSLGSRVVALSELDRLPHYLLRLRQGQPFPKELVQLGLNQVRRRCGAERHL